MSCSISMARPAARARTNMGVVYATSGVSAPVDLDTATLARITDVFQGVGTADPNSAFVVNPGMKSLFATYGAAP